MQVCIHRGVKEIGGSCVEVICGGKRLLIDLGLPLDAEINDRKYLPDISGFDGGDASLLAIIISHPHLDHFGLLAHISSKIPVIIGANASRILEQASPFLHGRWPIPASGINTPTDLLSSVFIIRSASLKSLSFDTTTAQSYKFIQASFPRGTARLTSEPFLQF